MDDDLPVSEMHYQKATNDPLALAPRVGRQPADILHVGLKGRQLLAVLGLKAAASLGNGAFRPKHGKQMGDGCPELVRHTADRVRTIAGGKMLADKPGPRSFIEGSESQPLGRDPVGEMGNAAQINLEELVDRVVAAGAGTALSFLFTGPPGTGKSAFARHLAARLGMDVLHKRASDLLGMYVGQTEANIARTFKEAGDNKMFLIFDEIDSLLADRRGAVRNWEISQINEMLTWMESHSLPFAMRSNFSQRLDPAVLRRVLFKVAFFPLTPQQIAAAFRRFFGCEALESVKKLDPLTPGDFVVVARKAKVLQVTNPATLGEMLRGEVELKRVAQRDADHDA